MDSALVGDVGESDKDPEYFLGAIFSLRGKRLLGAMRQLTPGELLYAFIGGFTGLKGNAPEPSCSFRRVAETDELYVDIARRDATARKGRTFPLLPRPRRGARSRVPSPLVAS